MGTVIIACWDDVYEEGELKKLLTGRATKLESQFRLTYSMILNLLRVEDLKARTQTPTTLGMEYGLHKGCTQGLLNWQKELLFV